MVWIKTKICHEGIRQEGQGLTEMRSIVEMPLGLHRSIRTFHRGPEAIPAFLVLDLLGYWGLQSQSFPLIFLWAEFIQCNR